MPPNSRNLFKKRGKIITKEGGLGQNPQKKTKRKNKQKSNNQKIDYGNL